MGMQNIPTIRELAFAGKDLLNIPNALEINNGETVPVSAADLGFHGASHMLGQNWIGGTNISDNKASVQDTKRDDSMEKPRTSIEIARDTLFAYTKNPQGTGGHNADFKRNTDGVADPRLNNVLYPMFGDGKSTGMDPNGRDGYEPTPPSKPSGPQA